MKTMFRKLVLLALTASVVVVGQARTPQVVGGAERASLERLALLREALYTEDANIEKLAVKRVQPPYPPHAQKYKIEGVVTVQVSVAGDGKVVKAEFVRGHNVFRSVSLDAAKRWEFKSSSALEGTIRFTFKLNE